MFDASVYWYVLFVRTGAEEKVAENMKINLSSINCTPFIPRKTCVFRRQGQKSLFNKICFPSYVFIESDKSPTEFVQYAFPITYKLKEAYRFLNYGERFDMAMRDEERNSLSKILGSDHCIDISKGFKEGDSVRIITGALSGNESKILKVNRNRNEAVIEIEMFGSTVPVSVGLEVVERITDVPDLS